MGNDEHLRACYRYIELNPVRAGMESAPGQYRWSRHAANAHGVPDELVTPHDLYSALGDTDTDRRFAYRELLRNALEACQVHGIRASVQTGTPLGNDRFMAHVEAVLGKRVGQARRGRPCREDGRRY